MLAGYAIELAVGRAVRDAHADVEADVVRAEGLDACQLIVGEPYRSLGEVMLAKALRHAGQRVLLDSDLSYQEEAASASASSVTNQGGLGFV